MCEDRFRGAFRRQIFRWPVRSNSRRAQFRALLRVAPDGVHAFLIHADAQDSKGNTGFFHVLNELRTVRGAHDEDPIHTFFPDDPRQLVGCSNGAEFLGDDTVVGSRQGRHDTVGDVVGTQAHPLVVVVGNAGRDLGVVLHDDDTQVVGGLGAEAPGVTVGHIAHLGDDPGSTSCRVSSFTRGLLLMTSETVDRETPARFATSIIVATPIPPFGPFQ